MTTTPPPPPGPPPGPGSTQVDDGPRVARDEVRDLARMRRTTGSQRTVAGVAGGLGRHLDIDPVILRVAFVVLSFFGGAGLVLYAAAWLLVPDDQSTSPPLGLDERSRTVALWIAAGVGAAILLGTSFGDGFVPFPVVVVTGIALLVVLQLNKRKSSPPSRPEQPWAAASSPGTAYQVDLDKTAAPATGPATGAAPWTGPTAPTQTLPPSGWLPPATHPVPAPRHPRRRGPVLFWFTLALCALGLGTLGVVDAAGASVASAAYPALVLATIGAMLVLGAFWGRAGGLVLLGLLTLPWLLGAVAVQSFDGDATSYGPTTAAEVRSTYAMEDGELVVDLRDVTDPDQLLGRTITVTGDVGHLEVLVPEGLPVAATGAVDGPGLVRVLGAEDAGLDASGSVGTAGDADVLTVTGRLDAGLLEIGSTR